MAQRYTGRWISGAYVDPKSSPVHTADPAHGEREEDQFAYISDAPPMQEVAPTGEYPGSEWLSPTMGMGPVDSDPGTSHEGSTHATDTGRSVTGQWDPGPLKFDGEQYLMARFAGSPGPEVNPLALQRGINSLAINNPDGFNPGHHEQHWVERKFAVGERYHDRRVVTVDTAYAAVQGVPPVPTPNGTPFASNQRPFSTIAQTPQMRREPAPVDVDLVQDTEPTSAMAGLGPWVVV